MIHAIRYDSGRRPEINDLGVIHAMLNTQCADVLVRNRHLVYQAENGNVGLVIFTENYKNQIGAPKLSMIKKIIETITYRKTTGVWMDRPMNREETEINQDTNPS